MSIACAEPVNDDCRLPDSNSHCRLMLRNSSKRSCLKTLGAVIVMPHQIWLANSCFRSNALGKQDDTWIRPQDLGADSSLSATEWRLAGCSMSSLPAPPMPTM